MNITIEDLLRDQEDAEQSYGEIAAQAGAERAQFGDAWPGAEQDLARMQRCIKRIETMLVQAGYAPCRLPEAPPVYDDETLPF